MKFMKYKTSILNRALNLITDSEILKVLVSNDWVSSVPPHCVAVLEEDKTTQFAHILYQSGKWEPDDYSLNALMLAGLTDLVQVVISKPRYRPQLYNVRITLVKACELNPKKYYQRLIDVLDIFLKHPNLLGEDSILEIPCKMGWYEVVERLLTMRTPGFTREWQVNPGANQCINLKLACENGHLKVVKMLLQDDRVKFDKSDPYDYFAKPVQNRK